MLADTFEADQPSPADVALFGRLFGNADFDPATLAIGSMAASAVGAGVSASGTLASGNYARQAGLMQQQGANYQAAQLESNAAQSFASGQRTALDTAERTRLAISSSTARAGASGVDAGVGSPVTNAGDLAQRGSYRALMDMFNGESAATGLRNQAAGVRYTGELEELGGEEKQQASRPAAFGTLASGMGGLMSTYGRSPMGYPEYRWGQ